MAMVVRQQRYIDDDRAVGDGFGGHVSRLRQATIVAASAAVAAGDSTSWS